MTQVQYDIIVACINKGAPVLSEELINAFNQVLTLADKYTKLTPLESREKQNQENETIKE